MKIDKNTHLFHGDCLEVIKKLPDNFVDLVLSDPPYEKLKYNAKWDNAIDFDQLWPELDRITKPSAPIVLFGQQPFTTKLIMSNLEKFKYEWVWDKHIPRGMQTVKHRPMNRHENILVFGDNVTNYYPIMVERDKPIKRKAYHKDDLYFAGKNDGEYRTYTHINPHTIIQGCWEKNKGKIHPTQKPVSLMEYLIKTYSKEGEMVIDFCFGSNSCGLAARNLNRKYIGIEKDEKFFNAGMERINKHIELAK